MYLNFGLGIVSHEPKIVKYFFISWNKILFYAYYYGYPIFYENLTVLLLQSNVGGEFSYNFYLAIHDKS